jgi:hypothetical protein
VVPKKTNSRPKINDDGTSVKAPSQKAAKAPSKNNKSNDSKVPDQIIKSSFVLEKPDNKPILIESTEEKVNQSPVLS